jgi:phage minor structural protein
VPRYNSDAEKVRTISAKESNYFNILQSIAETFEAWLDLEITRNGDGGIDDKKVKFKNYVGKTNYAGFKYGINLKDIQRTHESKNIVTKLIVKQNNNEHGENGFCTIARAGANPSGETSIYDFQYYFNAKLMNSSDYFNTLYSTEGANEADDTNLNGYFPRIKAINNNLIGKNEDLLEIAQELT